MLRRLIPPTLESRLRDVSIVPPWSGLLPGTSAHFGPPRRWSRLADYLRETGEPQWEVEPAERVAAPTLAHFGPAGTSFGTHGDIEIPTRRVFRARSLAILSADAHLVGQRDTFLWDTAWHNFPIDIQGQIGSRSTFRRKRHLPRRRLTGLTAALGSDWAVGSFGHCLHDSLSRWRLLQRAGFSARDFDHFVLFHPDSDAVRWFIRAAGIPSERLVRYDPFSDVVADDAVGTALGSLPPAHCSATMTWLRELALGAGVVPHERVYLSRLGYRRHPANSEELEHAFRQRGFHIVRADDGMAANRACLAAKVIVGVEGTNLASACFAPPGARVVILLPQADTFPVYPYMFAACGHHTAVVGASATADPAAPHFPLADVNAALAWAGV